MRILSAITCYNFKNIQYLNELCAVYKNMSFDVDLVILSNISKDMGKDIEVIVGMPSKDPWSLPFAHKKLFTERVTDYDLFIYSEDDTKANEANIRAFLEATSILPEDRVAGFMRYEIDKVGRRYITTMHSHFQWDLNLIEEYDNQVFTSFKNEHAAFYILTQDQLKKAINTGNFLVQPYTEKYDLACTAATDPYTHCGFKKRINISKIENFLLHHMPNRYYHVYGVELNEMQKQLKKLKEINNKSSKNKKLFETSKHYPSPYLDKKYYEEPSDHVLSLIKSDVKSVLSIGMGDGRVEEALSRKNIKVTGIPLDAVITESAKLRGIEFVSPDFATAFEELKDKQFDCILLINILQHIEQPNVLIELFHPFLNENGIMVGNVPNFNSLMLRKHMKDRKIKIKKYEDSLIHFTKKRHIKKWFKNNGSVKCSLKYYLNPRGNLIHKILFNLNRRYVGREIIFSYKKSHVGQQV